MTDMLTLVMDRWDREKEVRRKGNMLFHSTFQNLFLFSLYTSQGSWWKGRIRQTLLNTAQGHSTGLGIYLIGTPISTSLSDCGQEKAFTRDKTLTRSRKHPSSSHSPFMCENKLIQFGNSSTKSLKLTSFKVYGLNQCFGILKGNAWVPAFCSV